MVINSKNQQKRTQDKPKEAVGVRKKKGWRKPLFTFVAVIGVAIFAWIAFLLFGNNYKSNALEMKENATIAYRLSCFMLNDYLDNWISVETNKAGKNADGAVVSSDNPSTVLKWRREFFERNGLAGLLDELLDNMESNHGKMNLIPAKYRDTQDSFDKLLKNAKELANLTVNPGDSLMKMASDMNELVSKIKDNLEASDFNFLVAYDDLKAKVETLTASFNDNSLTDALMNDVDNKSFSAINAMNYKKMGFSELNKGYGVLYREVKAGKGRKPKDDTNVKLHYEGKLMDGTVFDSSYQRGQPAVMRPSQTVRGFGNALKNMKEGAKWEIFIPYSQAYGARAAGSIKPYSDLFFTIEILGFE